MTASDLPDEFYESIRHISSFKNAKEYKEYLAKELEKWKLKNK